MTDFQIPIPFAALFAGLYAGWLLWILVVRRRVTANRDAATTERMMQAAEQDALPRRPIEDQIAAAGLSLTATTFSLIRIAVASLGLLMALVFRLPGLVLIAAAIAGWIAPIAWLNQRQKARALSIDDDLPAALSGLAATLAMSQNLSEALQSAADAVSPPGDEAPRLLALELRRTAAMLASGSDLAAALLDLQKRSSSPTLAMLAFNLRVHATSGGGKFTRQVIETASRVRNMLEGRKRAKAFAGSANSIVLMIIGLTAALAIMAFQDPSFAAYYRSTTGAMVILIVAGVMALGYWFMRGLIEDVG